MALHKTLTIVNSHSVPLSGKKAPGNPGPPSIETPTPKIMEADDEGVNRDVQKDCKCRDYPD
jgi:hypothetical protein